MEAAIRASDGSLLKGRKVAWRASEAREDDSERAINQGRRHGPAAAETTSQSPARRMADGVAPPASLAADGIQYTGPISFGTFDLKAGKHTLTAEIVGANEKAVKSYMFGLDYARFKKPGAK